MVFLLAQATRGPITFTDITKTSGITFTNQASHTSRKYLPETMGAGVAMLDEDQDGRLDLYFVNGAALSDPMSPGRTPDKTDPKYWNRLFHNDGNGKFRDITDQSGLKGNGYGIGVAVGDYDNDGYPDLYVTALDHNALYHNDRNGTFTDVTAAAGVAGSGWSTGAVFLDYDRDGLLDLFVSRYLAWAGWQDVFCGMSQPGGRAYCHPDQFGPATHLLFHNEGHGHFRDVSVESGIATFPGKGLGVAINDYDRDGWPDILVANDSFPQQLFHNLKNGKFQEIAAESGLAYDEDGNTFAGMGTDFADYDNDGWPDVFIDALAKQKYALFHNERGRFNYVSGASGMSASSIAHSGWGVKFVDYDNDGFKDLFIGQGHVMDNIQLSQPDVRYLEPPLLLRNTGRNFVNVSAQTGSVFDRPIAARGVAFGDIDNDGFVDVLLNSNDGPAVMLRNTGNSNHWLIVETVGAKSNRDGIGAQLHLTAQDGREQYAMVTTASSYLSSSDKRVYFGLGSSASVKRLDISWPSGISQHCADIKADQIYIARESSP
ncbi:MAG TPA: CRTAC1 family protein [Bryobacteraceae bacterium]|nr:CRTAC1 family protein [Bryobacteraceae bacterium]